MFIHAPIDLNEGEIRHVNRLIGHDAEGVAFGFKYHASGINIEVDEVTLPRVLLELKALAEQPVVDRILLIVREPDDLHQYTIRCGDRG